MQYIETFYKVVHQNSGMNGHLLKTHGTQQFNLLKIIQKHHLKLHFENLEFYFKKYIGILKVLKIFFFKINPLYGN